MTYKNKGCDKYTSAQIESWIKRAEQVLKMNIEHNKNKNRTEFIESLQQQLEDLRADLILKKQEELQQRIDQTQQRLKQQKEETHMSYNFKICAIETSKEIQDMINGCQEELTEITQKRDSTEDNGVNIYNWTKRIKVLTVRLRKLKADLSLKQKEEMTSKKNINGALAEMKILFDY